MTSIHAAGRVAGIRVPFILAFVLACAVGAASGPRAVAQTVETEPNDDVFSEGVQFITGNGTFTGSVAAEADVEIWKIPFGASGDITITYDSGPTAPTSVLQLIETPTEYSTTGTDVGTAVPLAGFSYSLQADRYYVIRLLPILFSTGPWQFTVSGSATLPVELTRFLATVDGDAAVLRWETASETNNAGFEVQRRREGAWEAIGFVAGRGTTAEAQAYAYRTGALAPGTHRFRLKQVDYDGAFEYSPEVEAVVGLPGTHVLSAAYPNPFNPQTTFTLAVSASQRVRVVVCDALGREVAHPYDGRLEADETRRFTVDGTGLPNGTYLLRIDGETFRETQPLVLVR